MNPRSHVIVLVAATGMFYCKACGKTWFDMPVDEGECTAGQPIIDIFRAAENILARDWV